MPKRTEIDLRGMPARDPGIALPRPFLTPPANYPSPTPDIAICPLAEHLPARIQKIAFEIRPEDDARWPVSHAVAVGFPTAAKYDTQDRLGVTRLALLCVHAVAEGIGSNGSSDQVQFDSEISERPGVVSLSGMSGGPVFWSDGARHGLVGFVKQALDVTPKAGEEALCAGPRVNFICQRADYMLLASWTQYVDANWRKERDKINALIEQEHVAKAGDASGSPAA